MLHTLAMIIRVVQVWVISEPVAGAAELSHDLSSALVGLWRNKCNLKRQNKFKSPHFIKQFTPQCFLFTFRTPHAPTTRRKSLARIFSYANKWSRNIIIIEFITFFIFFVSQYFSFTLFKAGSEWKERSEHTTTTSFHPIKLENFLVFSCSSRYFFSFLWFSFANICRWMCVHAVCKIVFPGRTLNNFSNILFLLWYRKRLHIASSRFGWG